MLATTDRRETIRGAIATQLRLPISVLHDAATVTSLGLDSLGLAQAVVAVEETVGGEVDTERLSALLAPEMTLGALIDAVHESLVEGDA